MALPFKEMTFQYISSIRVCSQFPERVPDHKADYRRVTEPCASALASPWLACLSGILIAATSRRINGNYCTTIYYFMGFALTLRTFCILYFALTHTPVSTHNNNSCSSRFRACVLFCEQMNILSLLSETNDLEHNTFLYFALTGIFYVCVKGWDKFWYISFAMFFSDYATLPFLLRLSFFILFRCHFQRICPFFFQRRELLFIVYQFYSKNSF